MQALFNFASCSAVCTSQVLVADHTELLALPVMGAHFVILLTLIGGTQPISGGHFNPMVSAVMAYWGAIPWARLPLYVTAQVAGGIIGSLLQFSLLPPNLRDAAHAGVQVRLFAEQYAPFYACV
jgi:glycerol uptake facilitator-like aquaporin